MTTPLDILTQCSPRNIKLPDGYFNNEYFKFECAVYQSWLKDHKSSYVVYRAPNKTGYYGTSLDFLEETKE